MFLALPEEEGESAGFGDCGEEVAALDTDPYFHVVETQSTSKPRHVPTPCRSMGTVANVLSRDQMMKRLNRLFAVSSNGKYKVPDELLALWQDTENGGRQKVIDEFQATGYDKDCGIYGRGS